MAKGVDIDNIIEAEALDFSDNLMPNDGEPFADEESTDDRSSEADTRKEAAAEAAMILGSLPVIGHLDNWFKDEIANTDSIVVAHKIAKEYGVPLEAALIALDVVTKVLEIKRSNLNTLKEIYVDQK